MSSSLFLTGPPLDSCQFLFFHPVIHWVIPKQKCCTYNIVVTRCLNNVSKSLSASRLDHGGDNILATHSWSWIDYQFWSQASDALRRQRFLPLQPLPINKLTIYIIFWKARINSHKQLFLTRWLGLSKMYIISAQTVFRADLPSTKRHWL